MEDAALLLPDFALIALGALLARAASLPRALWDGVEKLVYLVLFPALLFSSITRNPLSFGAAAPLATLALALVGAGIVLALALRAWPGVHPQLHASGAQTAFRFNSYVALALAERLAGGTGLSWMALLIAAAVPLANVGAVWPLARQGGLGLGRELARNPLILATVAGLLFNATGWALPKLVQDTTSRVGSAAVPLGLMAVGAGLQAGALWLAPWLTAALLAIRHAVLPALALALLGRVSLDHPQQTVVMIFASLPTASSAYVLAVRMGGHGPYTAGLITLSTLLAMLTLPLWLGLWRSLATVG